MIKFFKNRFLLVAFLSLMTFGPANQVQAGSFYLNLGLGYLPYNLRLNFDKFDMGLHLGGNAIYGGPRLWKKGYYTGMGLFASLNEGGGVYGLVGKEWRPLSWFGVSVEGFCYGASSGKVFGEGYLGLGVVW